MADPFDTPGYRYSVNRFPGDGATTTWNLSFAGMDGQYAGYISKTHVKAYTILDSTGAETPLPLPSTAFIGPTTLKIEPAIPVGTTLVVYRDTPKNAPLLDYVDGALMIEKNLDTSNQQAIYAVAEMVDRFADALEDMEEFTLTLLDRMGQVEDVSNEAHDTADLALSTSNTALTQATAAVQTSQDALAGVAGATQAAIDATAAADAANAAAGLATTAANNANQAATDALDTSSQALTTAQAAENTANGIDAKATQALADAADAVATANGIDAKAQEALDTANSAVSTVESIVPVGIVVWLPTRQMIQAGWAAADGVEVARGDNPNLWSAVSASGTGDDDGAYVAEAAWQANTNLRSRYSDGDGSTTFRLPDYNGATITGDTNREFPVLRGTYTGKGLVAGATLAGKVGSHGHTATTTVAADGAHTPTGSLTSAGSHTHSGAIGTSGSHRHTYSAYIPGSSGSSVGSSTPVATAPSGNTGYAGDHTHTLTIDAVGDHTHTLTMNAVPAHTHTASTSVAASSGDAENRVASVNGVWVIKLG